MVKYVLLSLLSGPCYGMVALSMAETVAGEISHTQLGQTVMSLCKVEAVDEGEILLLTALQHEIGKLGAPGADQDSSKQLAALKTVHTKVTSKAELTTAEWAECGAERLLAKAANGVIQLKINSLKDSQAEALHNAAKFKWSAVIGAATTVGGTVAAALIAKLT